MSEYREGERKGKKEKREGEKRKREKKKVLATQGNNMLFVLLS